MQNHPLAAPAPIPGGAKNAATIPSSSSSTASTGYPPQSAAEQRQRQSHRPLGDGDRRDHSPDYHPYNDGP
ncbi:hypothetical protein M407DRAFT_22673, partial [Tulasnella calospora MUT 4182]